MRKRKQYRTFLEPTSRWVDSYIRVGIDEGEDDTSINLKLADCGRVVELGFNVKHTKNGYGMTQKQALTKLAKLEKALAMIREAIE